MSRTVDDNPDEILGYFWLTERKAKKPVMVTTGMCCRLQGRKGIYRILGMTYIKATEAIVLKVRKELKHKIGKAQFVDSEQMIFMRPPYNVPY